jgi:hypothetical protein
MTQLTQTLELGRTEEGWSRPILAAVGGSMALLIATLTVRPLQQFLSLALSSSIDWLLIGAASVVAVLLSQLMKDGNSPQTVARSGTGAGN